MRQVKFRAWDKKLKTMAKVISLSFYEDESPYKGSETESYLYYEKLKSTSLRSFDDIVLMQYTGLKDKHGVQIFEGDVVCYWGFIFAVVFKNGAFGRIEDSCFFPFYNHGEDHSKMFEVIGNIYENSDLLEEQK